MTDREQKAAAKSFKERWSGTGYEKGESQKFWIDLLTNVLGVKPDEIKDYIEFENQVLLSHMSFIDGYIPSTSVMIEQKSLGKDLRKGIKQSDGSVLSPFQQAKRYVSELPRSMHPKWIITCNFEEFLVYDMEKPNGEPEQIFLKDLDRDYYRLKFLIETGNAHLKREMEISLKAGEAVGKLYDALLKQYKDPESPETLKSLNMLCVRLVFCLYAEDAGIFQKLQFGRYLSQYQAKDVRRALIDLFKVLDTKDGSKPDIPDERDPYLDEDLAAFPYVNGGLFADENIEIPRFTDEIVHLLVDDVSAGIDWSEISPTIFGAVFESTLNPETRRSGGMHYTSVDNIHKVIDPLFLDDLTAELDRILTKKRSKSRIAELEEYRSKLGSLVFFDPACGSGNFLTESFTQLRKLENRAIKAIIGDNIAFAGSIIGTDIKVSIRQFYGIEINDFAVAVARTALWIAESQMIHETEEIINDRIDFLPLKSYANIVEGNALRIDWESVVPKDRLSYIMGNPPFVGLSLREDSQQADMEMVFQGNTRAGRLDYVAAWYRKATVFMSGTNIECAFVSTNSITQGEQVPILWEELFIKYHIVINFAHRTFLWSSEAKLKASVKCVIIGFSQHSRNIKVLYDAGNAKIVENINGYLVPANNVFIELRGKAPKGLPKLVQGNKSWDSGYLVLSEQERNDLITKYPESAEFIKLYLGAKEFINGIKRYCLWLKDVSPKKYRNIPEIMKRLEAVADVRRKTKTEAVHKQAETPYLFSQIRQPETDYVLIPETSSENRRYVPIGFMNKDVIASNTTLVAENMTLYHFGVLTSNVHMSWMRTVCGRLKSDYRYSPSIYNNFPWCTPTNEQKAKIEKTAQMILDARAKYPDSSLADLYDELTMPPELRKAHQANDRAVMEAYGFWGKLNTESECVAELMKMYRKLTEN